MNNNDLKSLFVSLLILLPTFANADLYKWVDENGRIHYGDKPSSKALSKKLALPRTETRENATTKKKSKSSNSSPPLQPKYTKQSQQQWAREMKEYKSKIQHFQNEQMKSKVAKSKQSIRQKAKEHHAARLADEKARRNEMEQNQKANRAAFKKHAQNNTFPNNDSLYHEPEWVRRNTPGGIIIEQEKTDSGYKDPAKLRKKLRKMERKQRRSMGYLGPRIGSKALP